MKYEDIRSTLQSGDIVFFSHHDQIGDKLIKWWQKLLRLKSSKYSHIGIIVIWHERVILFEASYYGGCRIIPLSQRMPDMIVRTKLTWSNETEDFAVKQLGKQYSILEAIGAGFGLREAFGNRAFICTEYVGKICDLMNYQFPHVKQLPAIYFEQLKQDGKELIELD